MFFAFLVVIVAIRWLKQMATLFKNFFKRTSTLDVIPISRLLLFKDLVKIKPEQHSYDLEEINELW